MSASLAWVLAALLAPGEGLASPGLVSRDYRETLTLYDPAWLASLWPKLRNGAHLVLDEDCWRDLSVFFRDTLEGRAWALSAVDATGSVAPGLLWGNRYWLGCREQCEDSDSRHLDLVSDSSLALDRARYLAALDRQEENTGEGSSRTPSRVVMEDDAPPFRLAYSVALLQLNLTDAALFSRHLVWLGLCLPRSCRGGAPQELLELSLRALGALRGPGPGPGRAPGSSPGPGPGPGPGPDPGPGPGRAARVLRVRVLADPRARLASLFAPAFFAVSAILICITILTIIGTVVDTKTHRGSSASERSTPPPSFKSFIKPDQLDSMLHGPIPPSADNYRNLESSTKTIKMSGMLDSSTVEPFHTIDGLIPNKYTEIVSGVNLFPNKETLSVNNLSNRNHVNLVTVRKTVKTDKSPTITLDIITMKTTSSSDSETISSELRGKGNKYVLTDDEVSSLWKAVHFYKSAGFLEKVCCMDKEGALAKFLFCFSLKSNAAKIFSKDVGEDTLAPVHGLKFISLLWVILIHTCLVVYQLSDNKVYRGQAETNILYRTISNGTYSVDTFFVLSGALVSYLFCQTMKRHSSHHLMDMPGFLGKLLQVLAMIIYRYIRLTPPYLLILGLVEISSKYLQGHSALELPGRDHVTCRHYWWRNALYINTFYPLREACMSWSWYLSTDTQLYVVGTLLLVLCAHRPRALTATILSLVLAATATSALVALRAGHVSSVEEPLAAYDLLYNKPWTRAGPYLAGLGAGWILSRLNCCLLLSKTVSAVLWLLSCSVLGALVWGAPGSWLGGALSEALAHPAWGLAVAWVLMACVTGHAGPVSNILSWRVLFPLSRLSFCVYLLHPLLLKVVFLSAGGVQHVAPETVLVQYIGIVVLSFVAALPLALMVEAPAVALLRLLRSHWIEDAR